MQGDKLEMQENLDPKHACENGREHDLQDREIEHKELPDDDLVAGDASFLEEEPEHDAQEKGEGFPGGFRQEERASV